MKQHQTRGASLYYASDKNLFDALTHNRVDVTTILKMFNRRNTLVSKLTNKEELARRFSRLPHDLADHQDIANKMGVVARREKLTAVRVSGISDESLIQAALHELKSELTSVGDAVSIKRENEVFKLRVEYTFLDLSRSDFSQSQTRDASIDLIKSGDTYVVRNENNNYINGIRESLLHKIGAKCKLENSDVNLFDVPAPEFRSRFFLDLCETLPGFSKTDVTDAYVYKPRPGETEDVDDGGQTTSSDTPDAHIYKVTLKGVGVSQSELLSDLSRDDYYIVKIGWTSRDLGANGHAYDIEAVFTDPVRCAGFSFILAGVYQNVAGKLSPRRRSPTGAEIDLVARVLEQRAFEVSAALRSEYFACANEEE